MIKVKFLKNIKGVIEGEYHPTQFFAGKEYEISESLYKTFINLGVIENGDEPEEVTIVENKQNVAVEERETKELYDNVDLTPYTKEAIISYAKNDLNIELDGHKSKENLIKEIQEKMESE